MSTNVRLKLIIKGGIAVPQMLVGFIQADLLLEATRPGNQNSGDYQQILRAAPRTCGIACWLP
jgi:hypothetical protein